MVSCREMKFHMEVGIGVLKVKEKVEKVLFCCYLMRDKVKIIIISKSEYKKL